MFLPVTGENHSDIYFSSTVRRTVVGDSIMNVTKSQIHVCGRYQRFSSPAQLTLSQEDGNKWTTVASRRDTG